jgi:hypothetical protein
MNMHVSLAFGKLPWTISPFPSCKFFHFLETKKKYPPLLIVLRIPCVPCFIGCLPIQKHYLSFINGLNHCKVCETCMGFSMLRMVRCDSPGGNQDCSFFFSLADKSLVLFVKTMRWTSEVAIVLDFFKRIVF